MNYKTGSFWSTIYVYNGSMRAELRAAIKAAGLAASSIHYSGVRKMEGDVARYEFVTTQAQRIRLDALLEEIWRRHGGGFEADLETWPV